MMHVDTAIRARGSTRAFLQRPVARSAVQSILDTARYAPSGSNIQPWSVHVVAGAARDSIVTAVTDAAIYDRASHPGVYDYYPPNWREPYLARRRACGWGLYSLLGIAKGDRPAGLAQELRNFEFFGAPVGLFFFIDSDLPHGAWLDCGMFIQTVMIAAQGAGFATCPQAAWAPFHRLIRASLDVPDTQTLICGMALGYADPRAPVNGFRPVRLSVREFTAWHGFEAGE